MPTTSLDRIKEKLYRESPSGQRANRIAKWKHRGLRGDLHAVYDDYMSKSNCQGCGVEFGPRGRSGDNYKVMHHNHATGEYIDTICNRCNKMLARDRRTPQQDAGLESGGAAVGAVAPGGLRRAGTR